MIPFCIEQAFPSDDSRNNNIISTYDYCKKDNLNNKIISYIIDVMYEFCDEHYGHNIKITSYDDFCHQFWKINENYINGWSNIFHVYYFEKKWINWNIEQYKEEIYIEYNNKYLIKNIK
jgi:hypothetical protein